MEILYIIICRIQIFQECKWLTITVYTIICNEKKSTNIPIHE